jgi:hypothetical protein
MSPSINDTAPDQVVQDDDPGGPAFQELRYHIRTNKTGTPGNQYAAVLNLVMHGLIIWMEELKGPVKRFL